MEHAILGAWAIGGLIGTPMASLAKANPAATANARW